MSSTLEFMHRKYFNKSINYFLRVGPYSTTIQNSKNVIPPRKTNFVSARFCEGGHICTLPRECCTQGCCPPYQSGPRQLPPASEHVLNLFFISHWFFWCVVVAIILAILCAYSLWKKRRTLCGWGFNEHHVQSEGDSAGSCYAPPQYSRCNSFHHPPPPYTEVTSKPDLYPLVFTCNSENGKNGSSYLMVQYFRNYIVRPAAASLSAASTVDSLSSSFICNVNEANTLVPPPYSRAASPDIGFSTQFQQHYILPRSASQLVCMNNSGLQSQDGNLSMQQAYQQRNSLYTAVGGHLAAYDALLLPANSLNPLERDVQPNPNQETEFEPDPDHDREANGRYSRRYMENSQSSISDIFVNSGVNVSQIPLEPVHATQASIQTNPLHRMSAHSVTFASEVTTTSPLHHSRRSLTTVSARRKENVRRQDMHMLRRSLESCRQILQFQPRSNSSFSSMNETNPDNATPLRNSNSQERTGEVKHVLQKIPQLQTDESMDDLFSSSRPILQHTLSSPEPASKGHSSVEINLQRCLTMPETTQVQQETSKKVNPQPQPQQQQQSTPSLTSSKKKYYTPIKHNKSMYIPMVATNVPTSMTQTNRCFLKSPVSSMVGSSFFANRGRGRKVWVTRSAPTTPGTCLPPNCFGDDSPLLLNEHEEDEEGEQNAELEQV